MNQPLPVFTREELRKAHRLLAAKVVYMEGRKFEEGDWQDVYCAAKGIELQGWSNLNIDVTYGNVGVEHKMLRMESGKTIATWCGTTHMHPAATRAIRVPRTDGDPDEAMREVFRQYKELLDGRAQKVREASGTEPDMRTGWLLWQESLREFLYFEEATVAPDPHDYTAQWRLNATKGARIGSKNLWIYERATGRKRYSVTTEAGVKIQPYFDVPPLGTEHLYIFTVQGEELGDGAVRIWVSTATARELAEVAGDLSAARLASAIARADPPRGTTGAEQETETVRDLIVTIESYQILLQKFDGVSDEHRMRLLVAALKAPAA